MTEQAWLSSYLPLQATETSLWSAGESTCCKIRLH